MSFLQIYLILCLLLRIHDMQKNIKWSIHLLGYIFGPDSKESTYQCKRLGFDPWVRKTSWRREWKPTLVFLPGESHGWRSLEGYSPWDCKESDMTERISIQIFFSKVKWREVTQSCLTLCDPMDCSPPGSSTHGILQARVLEWGAIVFSKHSL